MKCIYCASAKPPSAFRKPEHIIPQSFGRFRNNLTLHGKVCDECNQFFGDNIETWLARDTYEGLQRFNGGIRPPAEYHSMGRQSNIRIQINEGVFRGSYAFLEYRDDLHQLVLVPLPQIGFKLAASDKHEYFTLSRFPTLENFDASKYDLGNPRAFIVLGLTDLEAAQLLGTLGLSFRRGGVAEMQRRGPATLETEVTTTLNEAVRRTIAKIGFNYLAYWNNSEALLDRGFDQTRRWIRYGEPPTLPLVHMFDDPILGDEPIVGPRRSGHIVAVKANDEHDSLFAEVSLFNFNTYKCLLCWSRIPAGAVFGRGHFFNLGDMNIIELTLRERPAS